MSTCHRTASFTRPPTPASQFCMAGFSPSRGYASPRGVADDAEEGSSFLSSFSPFGLEDLQKEKPARRWMTVNRTVLIGEGCASPSRAPTVQMPKSRSCSDPSSITIPNGAQWHRAAAGSILLETDDADSCHNSQTLPSMLRARSPGRTSSMGRLALTRLWDTHPSSLMRAAFPPCMHAADQSHPSTQLPGQSSPDPPTHPPATTSQLPGRSSLPCWCSAWAWATACGAAAARGVTAARRQQTSPTSAGRRSIVRQAS